MQDQEEHVAITLGRAEALILFELLADFHNGASLPVSDNAERLSLVMLYGSLEKALLEPFSPDYRDIIGKARTRLITEFGDA